MVVPYVGTSSSDENFTVGKYFLLLPARFSLYSLARKYPIFYLQVRHSSLFIAKSNIFYSTCNLCVW